MQDIGCERAVLAALMTYGQDAYHDIGDIVTSETFTIDSNEVIYKCLIKFFETHNDSNTKPDIPSILAAATDIGLPKFFESTDEKKYLRSISNFPIELGNARKLAIRLRKLQVARELHNQHAQSQLSLSKITGNEDISEILSLSEGQLSNFIDGLFGLDQSDISLIGDGLDEYIQNLQEHPCDNVGVPSYFKIFNKMIGGGYRRNSVNIIVARPKCGKTTFGITEGMNATINCKIPIFYLDMEMDKVDFWNKMLANLSGITLEIIERGQFDSQQLQKVQKAKEIIKELKFYYVNISGKSFEETLCILKRVLFKHVGKDDNGKLKDCLVIYDYLRLNNSESITNTIQEYQALGFQIIALKNFTKKYEVPILTFVQANRDGIDKEETDIVSGSDRIVWLCNNLSLFKRRTEEEMAEDRSKGISNPANRKLKVLATRHGKETIDNDYINIHMDGDHASLKEGKTRNYVQSKLQEPPEGFISDEVDKSNEIEFS